MQYLPPFGESRLLQCIGSQQPSYNSNPAFQVPSAAVFAAGSVQDCIVGEGEVVAVANIDGTGSYFFIPTAVRWSPELCNGSGYFRNFCPNKNFTSGVWLVTSITNPVPVQMFSQVIQKRGCVVPPPVRAFVSDVNLNNIHTSSCVGPQFHAQFHNDGCTSTTDLHYFFPSLRCREWVPHLGACVQADLPPKGNTYHYECVNKPNGGNTMSVRSYDNNTFVETNSMCVDQDVSTLPETKDQYVFTVTENSMQTRTGISQPTQMLCNLDACVEMQNCDLKQETNTQICEFMTPLAPIRLNSSYETTKPCSCGSIASIEKTMSKTNRILQFQEIPSQTDPHRQTQHTETLCTCSREPCQCNTGKCDVNDKLTATFDNSIIQTELKTNVNTTQMCCCFNSNCGTCDCIFNDTKNKHKLTTTFEEKLAQTDQIQGPRMEDAFSSYKPESCDRWTDRSQTSFPSQESDCQTTSKEIRSKSTGTYTCVCEYCNCGEDTEESGYDDEPYCTCRTGRCCCNPNSSNTSSTQHVSPRETEIRSSHYR